MHLVYVESNILILLLDLLVNLIHYHFSTAAAWGGKDEWPHR